MKIGLNNKKIIVSLFIFIIIIILMSTIVFAVFKVHTIGEDKLKFSLVIKNGQTGEVISNGPKLKEGMIPIKWDEAEAKWKITNQEDQDWYNYDNTKKWANVMMSDGEYNSETAINTIVEENQLGSMFVWIPRYEYKIAYNNQADKTEGGTIEVNFIDQTITTPNEGYTIHPAFRDGSSNHYANGEWGSEISGFWAAKFEVSKETYDTNTGKWNLQNIISDVQGGWEVNNTSVRLVSKPNRSSWIRVSIHDAYRNSKASTYNIANASELNSHMMKNSEWGAIAYLAYSEFGKGSQPHINNYVKDEQHITGYSSASEVESEYTKIAQDDKRYSTVMGVNASTTGNIYGIYDMNGGTNEFTAAYIAGNTKPLETNPENKKYCMVYNTGTISQIGKIGDATIETYRWDNSTVGSPKHSEPEYTSSLYFMRGGGTSDGAGDRKSGIFSSYQTPDSYRTCFRGYRTVLIIE